ncbi:MAG TPA: protein translocase subunit SecF [Vicinamibacterales bacterium]|nr:protein translocase subunit SecF [Vicinamibacterales bacterium]
MQIFKNPNFDFVRWRWHALALSALVIAAGIYVMATRGLQYGVEFSGGTIVIVKFEQAPDLQRIREAVAQMPGGAGADAIVQQYGTPEQRQVAIRLARAGEEAGGDLSREADAVVAALKQDGLGTFEVVGSEIVGPTVGRQLKRQGTLATILALGGILVYIALRFQFSFAVGAVVATVHDLLVTMAFLSFFRYDITLNVIAGILTITGYSVNDTIVVFDRVRENMRAMRRDDLAQIVNVAVNQTLSRTVITAGTTLLSVIALFLFGGEVLKGFAFTMLVGIISGTYSTVFIAAAIAILWQGRRPLKGQAAAAAAAAPARKPGRRRAS